MAQRNGYYAIQEYALIAMLGDDNENVGMAKVLAHRKEVAKESAMNDDCPHALNSSLIRLFDAPTLKHLPISILTCKSPQQLQALQIQK